MQVALGQPFITGRVEGRLLKRRPGSKGRRLPFLCLGSGLSAGQEPLPFIVPVAASNARAGDMNFAALAHMRFKPACRR